MVFFAYGRHEGQGSLRASLEILTPWRPAGQRGLIGVVGSRLLASIASPTESNCNFLKSRGDKLDADGHAVSQTRRYRKPRQAED